MQSPTTQQPSCPSPQHQSPEVTINHIHRNNIVDTPTIKHCSEAYNDSGDHRRDIVQITSTQLAWFEGTHSPPHAITHAQRRSRRCRIIAITLTGSRVPTSVQLADKNKIVPIFVVHECGTRPFVRWVRSQGRSPHPSGSSKNASGSVSIPLFEAQGDKSNPFEEG